MTPTTSSARRGEGLTHEAVSRWARALPAASYAITAVPADPNTGASPHRRSWDLDQLLRAIPWLRHLNSLGHHIVGRPVDPRHVLIDDLHPDALTALRRRHHPAAVVASSPGSIQAWITVSETSVDPAVADSAAKVLARRYGGDLCAARASQPGRVVGFTNRKARHRAETGLFPYALLLETDGPLVDPGSGALLREAGALRDEKRNGPCRPMSRNPGKFSSRSAAEEHAAGMARLLAALPPGATPDRSRADVAIARRMASRGASIEQIMAVVLAGERATGMSGKAAEGYARRTSEAALRIGEKEPDG